jgi:hypothetical protein
VGTATRLGLDTSSAGALRSDWNESMDVPLDETRRIDNEHAARGGFRGSRSADIAAHRESVIARARTQRTSP